MNCQKLKNDYLVIYKYSILCVKDLALTIGVSDILQNSI